MYVLLALWGFAEAWAFFVIVDALLFWASVRAPEKWLGYALFAIGGAALGVATHALFAWRYPGAAHWLLVHTPLVTAAKIERARALLDKSVLYALVQPYSGIPVKVWTVVAHSVWYVPIVIASRSVRMGLVAWLGSLVGTRFAWTRTRAFTIAYWAVVLVAVALI